MIGHPSLKLPPGRFYGETSDRYQVAEFRLMDATYPPGMKLPKHSHTRACFSVMLQGALSETYERGSLEWRPFSIGFNPPDEEHSNFIHDTGARFLIVEVTPEWLERMSDYSGILKRSFISQTQPLRELGFRLYREAQHVDAVSQLAIEGLLFGIVAEISRLDANRTLNKHPRWLAQAVEIIHAHFADSLTIAAIAETVGVHPVHLARVFRIHHHCTIGDYIRQLRLDFVCHELSTTSVSLAQIACQAGFYDQGHLSRTFKRFAGMTPTQYRASNRTC